MVFFGQILRHIGSADFTGWQLRDKESTEQHEIRERFRLKQHPLKAENRRSFVMLMWICGCWSLENSEACWMLLRETDRTQQHAPECWGIRQKSAELHITRDDWRYCILMEHSNIQLQILIRYTEEPVVQSRPVFASCGFAQNHAFLETFRKLSTPLLPVPASQWARPSQYDTNLVEMQTASNKTIEQSNHKQVRQCRLQRKPIDRDQAWPAWTTFPSILVLLLFSSVQQYNMEHSQFTKSKFMDSDFFPLTHDLDLRSIRGNRSSWIQNTHPCRFFRACLDLMSETQWCHYKRM